MKKNNTRNYGNYCWILGLSKVKCGVVISPLVFDGTLVISTVRFGGFLQSSNTITYDKLQRDIKSLAPEQNKEENKLYIFLFWTPIYYAFWKPFEANEYKNNIQIWMQIFKISSQGCNNTVTKLKLNKWNPI